MTTDRTGVGQEIEAALGEVVAHVRGEAALPCRVVDAPAADRVVAKMPADGHQPLSEPRPRQSGRASTASG